MQERQRMSRDQWNHLSSKKWEQMISQGWQMTGVEAGEVILVREVSQGETMADVNSAAASMRAASYLRMGDMLGVIRQFKDSLPSFPKLDEMVAAGAKAEDLVLVMHPGTADELGLHLPFFWTRHGRLEVLTSALVGPDQLLLVNVGKWKQDHEAQWKQVLDLEMGIRRESVLVKGPMA